jgi:putative transposase
VAASYEVHSNLAAQWRDQALGGLVRIFSRARESDWQAKVAAYEAEKQDLYAEIGRLSTQLTWLKKSRQVH